MAALEAMKARVGEIRWARYVEQARVREAAVKVAMAALAEGARLEEAHKDADPGVAPSTLRKWITRYEEGGLLNLIDRRGQSARHDASRRARVERRKKDPRRSGRATREAYSFLRWAGSKSGTVARILERMPKRYTMFYEPMVGAGHVFLRLAPRRAVLADANPELMTCYEVIRDRVDELLVALEAHVNTYDHFMEVRALDPFELDPVERAARMLYLNRTGFNGLYRLNRRGEFNVPYGWRANPNLRPEKMLRRISQRLAHVELRCGDFTETVADAPRGSLVYFDPPYYYPPRPRSGKQKTRLYGADPFGEAHHRRLAEVFKALDARGCHVFLSNADEPLVRKLYAGYCVEVLDVDRPVNSRASERAGWTELLIRNRPPEQIALPFDG